MTRYEYVFIELRDNECVTANIEKILNAYGIAGFDFVTIEDRAVNTKTILLKREYTA